MRLTGVKIGWTCCKRNRKFLTDEENIGNYKFTKNRKNETNL